MTKMSRRTSSSDLHEKIRDLAVKLAPELTAIRRDLHRHPELAWTEFRTAAIVAQRLEELGFEVLTGPEVCSPEHRLGVPDDETLEQAHRRALDAGTSPERLAAMRGGYTGVVGILDTGRPGPVVALRVDIDALPIEEAGEEEHRPAQEGFSSAHRGLMHACGHDAHTAMGLGVAQILAHLKEELSGTVKLVFQPGEEGGRGALPMAHSGIVDDVDHFLGVHIGMGVPSGVIHPAVTGFLASRKLDVSFSGRAAHAGAGPQEGRNALLAAAHATTALYGISRSSAGDTRVNVGTLHAGSGRNVIADSATMLVEVRGAADEVTEYMASRARKVIEGAALAQEVDVEIVAAGSTTVMSCDEQLVRTVEETWRQAGLTVEPEPHRVTGSEDCSVLMSRVQQRGGAATYVAVGSDLPTGHHTRTFDVDEGVLAPGAQALAIALVRLLN
jgi:aminobenzoyl-glutamate utilization protein A